MTDCWSNETILKFLELYGSEGVIWDHRDKNHKLKHKIREAWKRISANMGNIPVVELKLKKKSLMATFRPLMKKKIASIKSGAEGDDIFQPIWFAFDLMESFLGPIYDAEETVNTENEIQRSETTTPTSFAQLLQSDEIHAPRTKAITNHKQPPSFTSLHQLPTTTTTTTHNNNHKTDTKTKLNVSRKRSSKHFREDPTETSESFGTLNSVLRKKKGTEEDECDLYCKLLVRKLRRYPEGMRDRIMYKIDGLLLDNPPPDFEQRPSSSCSNYSTQSVLSTTETRPIQLPYIKKEPEVVLGNTFESFTYLL